MGGKSSSLTQAQYETISVNSKYPYPGYGYEYLINLFLF